MTVFCSALFALSAAAVTLAIYFYNLKKFHMGQAVCTAVIPALTAFAMLMLYDTGTLVSFLSGFVFYDSIFLVAILFNKGKRKSAIYSTALNVSITSLLQSVVTWLIELGDVFLVEWLTASVVNFIFAAIVFWLQHQKKIHFENLRLIPNYVEILILLCIFLTGGVVQSFMYDTDKPESMAHILTLLLIIVLIAIIFALIFISMRHGYHKNLSELLQREINAKLSHYKNKLDEENKLRRFKHDYRNHLLCISSLAKAGQTEDLLEYISELVPTIFHQDVVFDSGNYIADAIMKEKYDIAKSNNISFEFDGNIPNYGISNVDICIILSNALDNALEACLKCENDNDRFILISCRTAGKGFFAEISNSVNEDVNTTRMTTTKPDKSNHGLGLSNIYSAVKRYKGISELECCDKIFTLKIRMYVNR